MQLYFFHDNEVFESTVIFSRCSVKKRQAVAKADMKGAKMHLVLTMSKVGGDASHGPHGVVAPMLGTKRNGIFEGVVSRVCRTQLTSIPTGLPRSSWLASRQNSSTIRLIRCAIQVVAYIRTHVYLFYFSQTQ